MEKRTLIILGTLFSFNILAWIGVFQLNHANLEVIFFDVGQGDAALIVGTVTRTSSLKL